MRLPYDFDNADPNESEIFTLNFVNDLDDSETISSVSVEIGLASGSDSAPGSRLDGSPAINGSKVQQRLTNLQPGSVYWLRALVTTSAGNKRSLWSHVTCNVLT